MAAEVSAELELELAKFRAELRTANRLLGGFERDAGKTGGGIGAALFGGIGGFAAKALGVVKRVFVGGVVTAVAAAGLAIGAGVVKAASLEQQTISFEVLIGDKSKAEEALNDLRKLGSETPLQFFDLADAGRKLLAFGTDADSLVATLRKIGDISTAIQAPIGEIAEIYGKAKVQGTLFAEDINQLTGRGIPVIQEFAKQLGVGTDQVKKLGSEGKITFANLERAFADLTSDGGRFAGMMERQSHSLAGIWSTFKDRVSEVLLEFGKPIADALRPMLEDASNLVLKVKANAGTLGAIFGDIGKSIRAAYKELSVGDLADLLKASLSLAFKSGVNELYSGMAGVFKAVGSILRNEFSILARPAFWEAVGNAIKRVTGSAAMGFLETIGNAFGMEGSGAANLAIMAKRRQNAQEAERDLDKAFAGGKGFDELMREAGDAFRSGRLGAQTIFDVTGEKAKLGGIRERLEARRREEDFQDLMREVFSDADEAAKKRGKKAADAAASGGSTGGRDGYGGGIASGVGPVARAIGLISGRQTQELILAGQRKQQQTLEQIEGHLRDIKGNKPKPKSPPAPPVGGRAVFARP